MLAARRPDTGRASRAAGVGGRSAGARTMRGCLVIRSAGVVVQAIRLVVAMA